MCRKWQMECVLVGGPQVADKVLASKGVAKWRVEYLLVGELQAAVKVLAGGNQSLLADKLQVAAR